MEEIYISNMTVNMHVKEYIQIHKNTTEMPVEEGYEQIVNTRGNANGKHMGKCSIT